MSRKNGYDRYLDYQYKKSGSFFRCLFDAIKQADSENLGKVSLGFPEEVGAYTMWTRVGIEQFAARVSPDNPLLVILKREYGLEE